MLIRSINILLSMRPFLSLLIGLGEPRSHHRDRDQIRPAEPNHGTRMRKRTDTARIATATRSPAQGGLARALALWHS
jgi:hypothetical protein